MRMETHGMDPGPVSLVYYSLCAAPGAAAGLLTGAFSRLSAGTSLITTIIGAIGGICGGFMLATVPTPSQSQGNDALVLAVLVLFTALCGWLLAFIATRFLRRSSP